MKILWVYIMSEDLVNDDTHLNATHHFLCALPLRLIWLSSLILNNEKKIVSMSDHSVNFLSDSL